MAEEGEEKASRELRIRIDADMHHRLHRLKLLRNKSMADAVHEALEHYFAAVVPEARRRGTEKVPPTPSAAAPADLTPTTQVEGAATPPKPPAGPERPEHLHE